MSDATKKIKEEKDRWEETTLKARLSWRIPLHPWGNGHNVSRAPMDKEAGRWPGDCKRYKLETQVCSQAWADRIEQ